MRVITYLFKKFIEEKPKKKEPSDKVFCAHRKEVLLEKRIRGK